MKRILALVILTCLAGSLTGQNKKGTNMLLFISPYSPKMNNQTISVYYFNARTGEATYKTQIKGIVNPSYMVISPDKRFLYSVNENSKGTISSFSLNLNIGELVLLNSVPSGGNGPTYITIDKYGKYVFCANYGSGNVGAIKINEDGSLSNNLQVLNHEAKRNSTGRQQGPHAHATVFSPEGKYLMSPDLGADKVYIYRYDMMKDSDPLEPADPPFVDVNPGSGPRHIDFHPDGKYAYVIHEMTGMISVWDYKDGKLAEKQNITMLPEGYTGRIGAADNHVSPDGKFLYASNRGDVNEIVIYKINKDGTLILAGRQSTMGIGPRNFVIDPSGSFLLVGNNSSNDVSIFKINKKSGLLTPIEKKIEIGEPGCLKFVEI